MFNVQNALQNLRYGTDFLAASVAGAILENCFADEIPHIRMITIRWQRGVTNTINIIIGPPSRIPSRHYSVSDEGLDEEGGWKVTLSCSDQFNPAPTIHAFQQRGFQLQPNVAADNLPNENVLTFIRR